MATFSVKTKNPHEDLHGKAKVYFTCHTNDLAQCFNKICSDIFKTHDCAIYYTNDMTESISAEERTLDLGRMGLFVIPVSYLLLSTPNRAMREDLNFAKENHIPILPILIEKCTDGLYDLYTRQENFGDLQYLEFNHKDKTAISYEDKLKKALNATLTDESTVKQIRSAFDAYIFLSYRKKDRYYALELIKKIHQYRECWGLAVWYDEYLISGEDFKESINTAMNNSKLFMLLVTPNLLEEANYVMRVEYPTASNAGLLIFPVEMVKTDRNSLNNKYDDLPECINIDNDESFKDRLFQVLKNLSFTPNGAIDHNHLIGLAYLDGIDVEVDTKRAIDLITASAEQNLPASMEKLIDIYRWGKGVSRDYHKALLWAEKLVDYNKKTWGDNHPQTHRAVDCYISVYYDLYYKKYHRSIALDKKEKQFEFDEQIIEIKSRFLGEIDPILISKLAMLSHCYREIGNYKKSIELLERAYTRTCNLLGEEHHNAIGRLEALAREYYVNGQYTESIEAHEKLFALASKADDDEQSALLSALTFLPSSYKMLDNYEKALEWTEKKYEVWCKLLAKGDVNSKDIEDVKKDIDELKKKLKRQIIFSKLFDPLMPKRSSIDSKIERSQTKRNVEAVLSIYSGCAFAIYLIIFYWRTLAPEIIGQEWMVYISSKKWIIYIISTILWLTVSTICFKKKKWINRFIWIFIAITLLILAISIYLQIK